MTNASLSTARKRLSTKKSTRSVIANQEETMEPLYERAAQSLGLKSETLKNFPVEVNSRGICAPMRKETGDICGTLYRTFEGEKKMQRGSESGIFCSELLEDSDELVTCEGLSDTLAVSQIGYNSVGLPSASNKLDVVIEVAKRCNASLIIICADNDVRGLASAKKLAAMLKEEGIESKILIPPKPHKDMRDWITAGATKSDLEARLHECDASSESQPKQEGVRTTKRSPKSSGSNNRRKKRTGSSQANADRLKHRSGVKTIAKRREHAQKSCTSNEKNCQPVVEKKKPTGLKRVKKLRRRVRPKDRQDDCDNLLETQELHQEECKNFYTPFSCFDPDRDMAQVAIARRLKNGQCELYSYSEVDGERLAQPFKQRINIGNGDELNFASVPQLPRSIVFTEIQARWSAASRRDWLSGEPAPTGSDLLEKLINYYEVGIYFPDKRRDALVVLAVWTVMTYLHQGFHAIPILCLQGPPNSGKTTALEALNALAFRGILATSISDASVYRVRENYGVSLCLDEASANIYKNPNRLQPSGMLRALVLQSYKRSGTVVRMESHGDGFEARAFNVYGPIALAAVDHPDPELASRCIALNFTRAPSEMATNLGRSHLDSTLVCSLLDDLFRFTLTHGPTVLRQDIGGFGLVNRDREIWGGLLQIASFAGQKFVDALLGVRESLAHQSSPENQLPTGHVDILQSLESIVSTGIGYPTASEILQEARLRDPEEFDQSWDAKRVAKVLKSHGFWSTKSNNRRQYKIDPASVRRTLTAYGI